MTPQEILEKCAEHNVKLKVVNGKLSPSGSVSIEFIKFSSTLIPYKQQIIDHIKLNHPELVESVENSNTVSTKPLTASNTPNDKVQRLRIPCIHLGPPIEKAAGCGCNGAVIHKCNVFEKCRRVGKHNDIAVCTSCDKYEGVTQG